MEEDNNNNISQKVFDFDDLANVKLERRMSKSMTRLLEVDTNFDKRNIDEINLEIQ
jgi:hypothetical protein